MSLYVKRLERGRFIWPSPAGGTLAISAAQLAYTQAEMLASTGREPAVIARRPSKVT